MLFAALMLGGCGKKAEEESASMLDDIKEETVEAQIEEEETEETEVVE